MRSAPQPRHDRQADGQTKAGGSATLPGPHDIDWRREQITTFQLKTSRGFAVPPYPQLRPLLERMRQARGGSPPRDEKVFRVLNAKKAISAACKRLELPAYSRRSFPAHVHHPMH